MIYSIISPDYEEDTEDADEAPHGLVQIDAPPRKPTN